MLSTLLVFALFSADSDASFLAKRFEEADTLIVYHAAIHPREAIEVKDQKLIRRLANALQITETPYKAIDAPISSNEIFTVEAYKGGKLRSVFSLKGDTRLWYRDPSGVAYQVELNSKRVHAALFPIVKDKLARLPVEEPPEIVTTADQPAPRRKMKPVPPEPTPRFIAKAVADANSLIVAYAAIDTGIEFEIKDRGIIERLAGALEIETTEPAYKTANAAIPSRDIYTIKAFKEGTQICEFSLQGDVTLWYRNPSNITCQIRLNSKRVHAVLFPLVKDKLPPPPVVEPLPSSTTSKDPTPPSNSPAKRDSATKSNPARKFDPTPKPPTASTSTPKEADPSFLIKGLTEADRVVVIYFKPEPPAVIEIDDRDGIKELAEALTITEQARIRRPSGRPGTRDGFGVQTFQGSKSTAAFSLREKTNLSYRGDSGNGYQVELPSNELHSALLNLFKDKLPPVTP